MSVTIAYGIIFFVCATVFGIAYFQEKRAYDREARRPSRMMYKRFREIRHNPYLK
jgi:hypothetical protein